jgi:hypothetical protein
VPADPETIGPYRVVRRLGQGGMGVVYEVTHAEIPRSLVLKQILGTVGERSLARFLREAEVMARVRHVGIVQIHQLGRTAEGPYPVAELVEGRPLSEVCDEGPVAPERAARITRGVADAVAAVHGAGVLHRDLKPANVMLRKDDSPVLLDFGLARDDQAQRLTKTGEVLGTPAYMSPEQAGGDSTRELDERCDVWGLGGILFALLTGEAPFAASSAVELLFKLLNTSPEWPSARGLPVPRGLEAILKKALTRAPSGRYASAAHLRADLDRFLAGQTPLAERQEGASRWPLAALVVVALVAAASGVAALRARGGGGGEAALTSSEAGAAGSGPGVAAAEDLWRLAPGEALEYTLSLVEVLPVQKVTFSAVLRVVPGEARADGVVPLAFAVTSLACSLGRAEEQPVQYDTRQPLVDHPLSPIGRAVDRTFTAELVPRTGQVRSMGGMAPLQAAVLEALAVQEELFPGAKASFERFVRSVLSDARITESMTTLTQVTGEGTRAPWRPDPTSTGRFVLPSRKLAPPAMESMELGAIRLDDRVFFDGFAAYADGRLQDARIQQELVQAGERSCTLTWSMKLRR